jgi:hypothetical protein
MPLGPGLPLAGLVLPRRLRGEGKDGEVAVVGGLDIGVSAEEKSWPRAATAEHEKGGERARGAPQLLDQGEKTIIGIGGYDPDEED